MPAMVISVEAVRVDNATLHDYLASEVALEAPEIGSTVPTIPIDNDCTDDEPHFGMPGGSGIAKIKQMKATIAMPSPQPAGDVGQQRNSRGLTGELLMSPGIRAKMAMMRMWMRMGRKNHHKSMMDQGRMGRTDLGPSDVDGYEGEDGNYADANEEEEASQADDGSTQNVEH